jgi:uncharacterized protein
MNLAQYTRILLGRLAGITHGGTRDMYQSFGYTRAPTIENFLSTYQRNGIANRILRAYPKATWRDQPVIRDEKGDSAQKEGKDGKANKNYSPFVEAVEDFFEKKRIMHYMERVDRMGGVGQYSILVMGFAGEANMTDPLGTEKAKLIYLQPYGEQHVSISRYETNPNDPRFGMPVTYSVQQKQVIGSGNAAGVSFSVHHSRVLHVADNLEENEVFGMPRLLPVLNWLTDLEKVVGAGAETFWLNSRQGMNLNIDKDANIDKEELAAMKEQAVEFENQLRRMLTTRGVDAQVLNANVADPKPNIDTLLDLISGATGIPKRILIGSERGELGGDADENNWGQRIEERRKDFAYPTILRPFLVKMIETGNLPKPQGQFWIEAPNAASLSPEKRADIALKKSQALATYANSPTAETIVPPQEFRTDFLEMTPESEYEIEELEPIDERNPEAVDQFDKRGAGEGDDVDQEEAA